MWATAQSKWTTQTTLARFDRVCTYTRAVVAQYDLSNAPRIEEPMNQHTSINRIYRLVWSEVTGARIAVAEISRRRGTRASGTLLAAVLSLVASPSIGPITLLVNSSTTVVSAATDLPAPVAGDVAMNIGANDALKIENGGLRLPSNPVVGDK